MDVTACPDGVTVEATLKQVWQSTNLPAQFRIKMATQGLTLSIFAGISDTLAGFKESFVTFFEESELGATPPARILSLTRMGTAWECTRSLLKEKANRTRLLEDPHRIPKISITEYTNYRKAFLDVHPEQFLTEHREPNKRSVEKVQADIIRHGILQFYDLGEESENVVRSTGFTRTPEMLMRLAWEDMPVNVTLEEDAMARIYAFFVTLEYLNLLSFSWYSFTNGVHSGGTLDYLMELEERRRETPGVNFILLADRSFDARSSKCAPRRRTSTRIILPD